MVFVIEYLPLVDTVDQEKQRIQFAPFKVGAKKGTILINIRLSTLFMCNPANIDNTNDSFVVVDV